MHSSITSLLLSLTALGLATSLSSENLPDVGEQTAVCGGRGFDNGRPRPYTQSTKSADITQSGCAALCAQSTKCRSYAIGDSHCLLYAAPVYGNFQPNSRSPYLFFDSACSSTGPPTTGPPTTGTPTTPSTGTPAGQAICGAIGYDRKNPQASYTSVSAKDTSSTYACQSLCRSRTGCQSFAFGNGQCFIYNAPVRNNFTPNRRSPYFFYDLSCTVTQPAPGNLVKNPGFETGDFSEYYGLSFTSSSYNFPPGSGHNSNYALVVATQDQSTAGGPSGFSFNQHLQTIQNKMYSLSVDVKIDRQLASWAQCSFKVVLQNQITGNTIVGIDSTTSTVPQAGTWKTYTGTATVTPSYTDVLQFIFTCTAAPVTTIWVDNLSVIQSN